MKKMFVVLAVLMMFVSANAFALTYTIEDNWINWPGYDDVTPQEYADEDMIGEPRIDSMMVEVNDVDNQVLSVAVQFEDDSRQLFDSLFINVDGAWDSWDYYVIERGYDVLGNTVGTLADSGLYSVLPDYQYTFVGQYAGRDGNPNGIDAASLVEIDSAFRPTYDSSTFTLTYNLRSLEILFSDNLAFAYTPYCSNDVIGSPVPEPGTLLLLGGGLVGLAYLRKRKKV